MPPLAASATVGVFVDCIRAVDTQCARLQVAQGDVWCVGVGERLRDRLSYDTVTGYPVFVASKGGLPPCLGDVAVNAREVIALYEDVKDESMDAKLQRVHNTAAWGRLVTTCVTLSSVVRDVNYSLGALLGVMGHNVICKPPPKKRRRVSSKKVLAARDAEAYAAELEKSMDTIEDASD